MSDRSFTGSPVFTALNGVTALGAGPSCDLEYAHRTFTMQTTVSHVGGTAISITLQGSLDGTNWTTLATSTSLTGDQTYSIDKPQRFVRANVGSFTGTSFTVSARIVAV